MQFLVGLAEHTPHRGAASALTRCAPAVFACTSHVCILTKTNWLACRNTALATRANPYADVCQHSQSALLADLAIQQAVRHAAAAARTLLQALHATTVSAKAALCFLRQFARAHRMFASAPFRVPVQFIVFLARHAPACSQRGPFFIFQQRSLTAGAATAGAHRAPPWPRLPLHPPAMATSTSPLIVSATSGQRSSARC